MSLVSMQGVVSLSLFMVSGPCLILMNNYILNDISFKYPIMLSSLGIFTSAVIVHILVLLKYITIRKEVTDIVDFKFVMFPIGILGLLQASALQFGILVYLYLSVSLIEMLKAFTPVITMILTFVTKQATPSKQLIGAILLLSTGTLITSANVSNFSASIVGFFIMFISALCESFKLVLSQKLLQGITVKKEQNNDHIVGNDEQDTLLDIDTDEVTKKEVNVKFTAFESLYYYAPVTFLCQMCLCLPLEYRDFMRNYDRNIGIVVEHWEKFVIGGFLGFSLNFAGFMITKITSGLYLKALSTFRSICLVVVSVVFLHDIVTFKQIMGYALSLCGFMYYSHLKLEPKKIGPNGKEKPQPNC